jgi:hypothetical protein
METEPSEKDRFLAGLKKIVSVPKKEILRREREAKEARKRARERKAKSGFVNPILLALILIFSGFALVVWQHPVRCFVQHHRASASRAYTCCTTIPSRLYVSIGPTKAGNYMLGNEAANQRPTGNQNAGAAFGVDSKARRIPLIPHWLELTTLIAGGVISGMLGRRVWEAQRQESLFRRVLVESLLLLCIAITVSLSELLWLFL